MKPILPSRSRTTHAAHAHPEKEDRAAASPKRETTYWDVDTELRDQLATYREREQLTNHALGKRLGMADGTVVSKWLNQRMDRNPAPFESSVKELLATDSRRREYGGKIISTNVVKKVALFIDRVRQTERVGVFTGEAGIGKTTGILSYLESNPSAVFLTINAVQNNARGVKQLLWESASMPSYCSGSYYAALVSEFKGSRRPIIVDSAQRLGSGGRELLFDFHDQTNCPVVLFGNPVILTQIARNDQQHSRTASDCYAELKDPKRIVSALISQHLSDPDEIMDLALTVATHPYGGHLRTLGHLLAEMRVLMEHPDNADSPRNCFISALASSVNFKSLAA